MSATETEKASLAVETPAASVSVNVSGTGLYPMTIESAAKSQGSAPPNIGAASQWNYPAYYAEGGQPQIQNIGDLTATSVAVSAAPNAVDQQQANVQAGNPQGPTVHFADTSGGFQQPPYWPNYSAAGQVDTQQPGYDPNVAYYQPGYSGYENYVQASGGADMADGAKGKKGKSDRSLEPQLPPCVKAQFLLLGIVQLLCVLGLIGVEVFGVLMRSWLYDKPVILVVVGGGVLISSAVAFALSCSNLKVMCMALGCGITAALCGICACVLGGIGLSIDGDVSADLRDSRYWSRLLVHKLRIVIGSTAIGLGIWLILAIVLMVGLNFRKTFKGQQPVAKYGVDRSEVTASLLPSAPSEPVEPASQSAPPAEQSSESKKPEEIS